VIPKAGFSMFRAGSCCSCQCTTAIPFDRILVAQSLEEGWPLLSADPLLVRYPAELIW
jgi:PIN domain nuclease of toxin-antitoxin system